MITRVRFLFLALLPLWTIPVTFVSINLTGEPAPLFRREIPKEAFREDRCTWHCHNHGCAHDAVLPRALSHDLFAWAVGALYRLGDVLVPGGGSGRGYGAANLLVFCALWPAFMYAMYLLALWQGFRLRELRSGRA